MAIDQVTTGLIKDDAVTASKIVAGAVVADIATGGVATAKLADDAVTAAKIADDAVGAAAIADDAVGAAAIANGAINAAAMIADDAITGGKLANDIAISTTGNIATTGSGTLTVAGAATLSGTTNNLGTVTAGTIASAVKLVGSRNEDLIVKRASTSTVDIDADFLTLHDASNYQVVLSSINLTCTISSTGVNGRDVSENSGNEKASDWYHFWVIYNGTTTACFATLERTEATVRGNLPSGYTYLKYVGSGYNDGSSNFRDFLQHGNNAVQERVHQINDVEWSGVRTESIVAAIPDGCYSALCHVMCTDENMSEYRASFQFFTASSGGFQIADVGHTQNTGTLNGVWIVDTIIVTPIINRTLYVGASGSAGDAMHLHIAGYHLNVV
jgi:hypothetical protein